MKFFEEFLFSKKSFIEKFVLLEFVFAWLCVIKNFILSPPPRTTSPLRGYGAHCDVTDTGRPEVLFYPYRMILSVIRNPNHSFTSNTSLSFPGMHKRQVHPLRDPKSVKDISHYKTAIYLPSLHEPLDMQDDNEYLTVLDYFYNKSLMLQDTSGFNKVLYFYLIDALAHIDYTVGVLAYNYGSPKNIIGAEYMRWRVDEEKKGDRAKFPGFINWLRENKPEKFAALPSLWQMIYDTEDTASYRSFRIVPDPDSRKPLPPEFFTAVTDELFEPEFLKSLYEDASLATLFSAYCAQH